MKLIRKEVGEYSYGVTKYGYTARVIYERKIIVWKYISPYYVMRKEGQYYLDEQYVWNSPCIFKTKEEAEEALEIAIAYGIKEPDTPYFKFTPIK